MKKNRFPEKMQVPGIYLLILDQIIEPKGSRDSPFYLLCKMCQSHVTFFEGQIK